MTANHKQSLRNSENLPQQIQMHLSHKQKITSPFFAAFQETTSILQRSTCCEKYEPHSLCISKIRDCQRRG